jgi:hypothetical protein
MKKQVPPGTPKPPDEMLRAGFLVFTRPAGPVDFRDMNAWWQWTIGANWQHPEGPTSNLDDSARNRERHQRQGYTCRASWSPKLVHRRAARAPTIAQP